MKNEEIKTHIEIEGCILTAECIDMLKGYQKNENELLGYEMGTIADTVCYLARLMWDKDSFDEKETIGLMAELGNLRNDMDKLRRP